MSGNVFELTSGLCAAGVFMLRGGDYVGNYYNYCTTYRRCCGMPDGIVVIMSASLGPRTTMTNRPFYFAKQVGCCSTKRASTDVADKWYG